MSRSFVLTASLAACGPDPATGDSGETAGSETASDTDGTADEVGDSGTTSTSTTSEDTTTNTTTTDDEGSCPIGSEGCPCTGGGGCDPDLVCEAGTCQPASTDTTDAGTDTGTDTGTTDTGTTDTTTGGGVCDPAPGDSDCTACLKDACCAEYEACLGDEDCQCVVDCVAEGNQQFQCFQMCGVMGFGPAIQDYLGCSQQSCGQDC